MSTIPVYIMSGEDMRRVQVAAYKNGTALATHTKDAHGGKFCETCEGCKELRAKGKGE